MPWGAEYLLDQLMLQGVLSSYHFFCFLAVIPAYFPGKLNIYADFTLFFIKLLDISMFFVKFATST